MLSRTGIKISVNQLIDFLAMACVFIFSTREYVSKLFPSIPYVILGYFVFLFLIASLVLEQRRINWGAVCFLLGAGIVCFLCWGSSSGVQKEYIHTLLIDPYAIVKLWVYFVAFSLIRNPQDFRKKLLIIAYVNMALLIFVTVKGLYSTSAGTVNYVGLGISGAVWIPLIIFHSFETEGKMRVVNNISSVVFVLFIAIYGNRGSLLAIVGFVCFCFVRYTKFNQKIAVVSLVGFVTFVLYLFQDEIWSYILDLVSKMGLYSRNLTLITAGRLSYSTHRTDEIWVRVLEAIKEDVLTGRGLCYDRVLSGDISIYAHNLVLEVLLSFGIVFGGILIFLHFRMGIESCLKIHDHNWESLFFPFYVTSTLLLMFNSSLCLQSTFWLPYGTFFAWKKAKKNMVSSGGKRS
ncbi:MAG: hypothetical protein IKX10_09665 [Lachnospiraceae bacterium]|nr:hypothetical protein [Lachnospiraceae bacterium]